MRKFNPTEAIDFFAFDKSFANHVSDFVEKYLKRAEINTKYNNKIKKLEESNEKLEKSIKSATNSDGHIQIKITENLLQIDTLKTERAEHIAKSATFTKSGADKEIIKSAKAWASGECSFNKVAESINKMFSDYNVEIDTANVFYSDIKNSVGKKLDAKTATKSDGKKITSINGNNVINILYASLYESMITAGTIKVASIPSVLREEYINKPKKKADAKEAKKAKERAKKEAEKMKHNATTCSGEKSKKRRISDKQ